jgi:hypothetical protein
MLCLISFDVGFTQSSDMLEGVAFHAKPVAIKPSKH